MKRCLALCASLGGLFLVPSVEAHHGRDFLIVQDYYLPGLLDGVLIGNFEMSRTGTDYEYGIEPEILIGILPRVAVGVSVGFANAPGDEWVYDSVTPSVHIQLTKPNSDFPIRLAVSAAYEFAYESGSVHSHGEVISSPSKSSRKKTSSQGSTSRKSSRTGTSNRSSSTRSAEGSSGGIAAALKSLVAPAASAEVALAAPGPVVMAEEPAAPAADPATDPGSGVDLGPDAPPDSGSGGSSHDHSSHSHGSGSSHSHSHTGAAHSHDGGDHNHEEGDHAHAEGADHSHEAGADGHHHGGGSIHTHGQDAFIGRFIMETDLGHHTKLVANLLNVSPPEGEVAWGYAAGVRHNLTHEFSLSLEAMGDFSEDGYHELNFGAFLVPDHSVTLRAGVGFGLTPASPDFSFRTGVVWRF
ncbi:MAG: hypothetical protein KDM63_01130 [Verrucomicrobiae bacterium]|nr:hypothetical protein [Verrucomicrobiae bacterium]